MSNCSIHPSPPPGEKIPWIGRVGMFLHRHQRVVQSIQWTVVLFYVALVVIPAFLPLPATITNMQQIQHLTILTNLTLFAEFCFWGIWWPFVLVSMVLFGRLWCGVFCPEGALSEFSAKHGLGKPIPKWMRWNGWPFVAFAMTTIYGQMVSVYQYPKAALLVLGGSTVGAMIIGFLFTKGKRSWCRYLCPVNGVFTVLAKLAPMHYEVNQEHWDEVAHDRSRPREKAPDCAPMVNIRAMKGTESCHMCGRCAGYNDSVTLSFRSPTVEVVEYGAEESNIWQSLIIVSGLMGIAIGAFLWSTSNPILWPTYQKLVNVLINHDIYWPLDNSAPWYILTNYPEVNDQFNWLYGACVIGFILGACVFMSTCIFGGLSISALLANGWEGFKNWGKRINHLAQGLIPIAAMGVFLGLSATTITLLKQSYYDTSWAAFVRIACLAVVNVYSLFLVVKILWFWRKQRAKAKAEAEKEALIAQAKANGDEAALAALEAKDDSKAQVVYLGSRMARRSRILRFKEGLRHAPTWLKEHAGDLVRVSMASVPMIAVLALVDYAWYLMFWGWN